MMRTLLTLAAAAVLSAGCLPRSITIDLDGAGGKVRQSEVLRDKSPRATIAQIDIEGVIGAPGLLGGGGVDLDDIAAMFDQAEKDKSIKAVLLRINSPGGSVAASETLYEIIAHYKDTTGRPVVVSMAEVAASGGYYAALAGDRIVAQPSSITGSVGVIIPTINAAAGLNTIGITSRSVTSGPNKDLANPLEAVDVRHYAILQGMVDEFYGQFRGLVLQRRPGLEDPDTLLDGRIFSGTQALKAGLVDELGGIRAAFAAAKQLIGVDSARLVKYHRGGRELLTPYARAHAPLSPEDASATWPLPRITRDTGPGVYYLWSPPGTLAP